MTSTVISVENVGKVYRLGVIGGGTLHGDLSRWWARVRRRPDPSLCIGSPANACEHGQLVWALRDVCLDVGPGQVVGIVGRNGAGKSTLLKILSRVTAPSLGTVRMNGRVGSLLEVGTGFHPELTGRENIFLNGAILGMARHETRRKLDEIAAFADVEQFLDTPVKRYSSGMYVRLAFAVAAHLDAEILLVDEVLAVGDAQFQKKCLGKMGEIAGSGRTVLFVSHNLGAVGNLCTSGVLLEAGAVSFCGSTAEVIARYIADTVEGTGGQVELPPARSQAYFSRVRILDGATGRTSSTVPVSNPVQVSLDYVVSTQIRDLRVSVMILDSNGASVFFSETRACEGPDDAREYRATVTIPEMFLAPKRFSVTADLHIPNVQVYDRRPQVLGFDIAETGSDAYMYAGADCGSVLVSLPWDVEVVARDEPAQSIADARDRSA